MAKTDVQTTSTELAPLPSRAAAVLDSLDIRFADPLDIQWRIAEQLATADSLDDLLNGTGPMGLREHMGEPFQITGVDFLRSRFPAVPLYAVVSGVNQEGEPVTFTTGALSVIIQLARGLKMGWWVGEYVKAEYSTDEPGPDGNRPYRLTRA